MLGISPHDDIAVSAFIVIFCYSSFLQSNENQSVVPEAMSSLYLKIMNTYFFYL